MRKFCSANSFYVLYISMAIIMFSGEKMQAQSTIDWEKSFGGSDYDGAYCINSTIDGGYVVAGYSFSNDSDVSGNHGYDDYWIVKIDASGNLEWQKSLGGNTFDAAYSIVETIDSGFIIAGYSDSYNGDITNNHGAQDYWIVKLDAEGNLSWQKSLGGTGVDWARAIAQTADGGFIVAGYSDSNNGDVTGNHGSQDYWIVKLDELGNITWQKSLGGTLSDEANAVSQTDDGGYIVGGYSYSIDGDVSGNHGANDYWVVKIDSSGSIQWQKSLGGTAADEANSIAQASDGGFVIAGTSESNDGDVTSAHGLQDFWVVKLNSSGDLEWEKTLGGSSYDKAYSISQTTDAGFIVAGETQSADGDVLMNHGSGDVWIVKLDSYGNLESEQTFGGSGEDAAYSIEQTADGGFVTAGTTLSADGDVSSNLGYQDYWIVKLACNAPEIFYVDSDGDGYGNSALTISSCIPVSGYVNDSTDCNDSDSSVHPDAPEIQNNGIDDNCNGVIDEFPTTIADLTAGSSLILAPNPAIGFFNLTLYYEKQPQTTEAFQVTVTNEVGVEVFRKTSINSNGHLLLHISFDQNLLPGIYLVKVISGANRWEKRLVVE